MERIWIYDAEDKKVEEICNKLDVTTAEVVEALFTALEENKIDLTDYI